MKTPEFNIADRVELVGCTGIAGTVVARMRKSKRPKVLVRFDDLPNEPKVIRVASLQPVFNPKKRKDIPDEPAQLGS